MVLILHTLHLTTLLIYNYTPVHVGILCSTFSRTKRFRNAFEVWYIFFLTWAQSQINLLEARFKNKFVGTSLARGRPKPIYAHSAVAVTRPKLKFKLRP